jgi:hypothetical protein
MIISKIYNVLTSKGRSSHNVTHIPAHIPSSFSFSFRAYVTTPYNHDDFALLDLFILGKNRQEYSSCIWDHKMNKKLLLNNYSIFDKDLGGVTIEEDYLSVDSPGESFFHRYYKDKKHIILLFPMNAYYSSYKDMDTSPLSYEKYSSAFDEYVSCTLAHLPLPESNFYAQVHKDWEEASIYYSSPEEQVKLVKEYIDFFKVYRDEDGAFLPDYRYHSGFYPPILNTHEVLKEFTQLIKKFNLHYPEKKFDYLVVPNDLPFGCILGNLPREVSPVSLNMSPFSPGTFRYGYIPERFENNSIMEVYKGKIDNLLSYDYTGKRENILIIVNILINSILIIIILNIP